MSRINREIFTTLDVNGPYLRIDTQPTSTTSSHNGDAVFTIGVSTYYLVGDEADTAGTEDAAAPTVDNDGNIVYEWYEIDANASPGTVTKLTDSTAYTGTTTNTLTVKSTQSPGNHLNQYYCIVSFDPTLVSGKYNTGDAVNESLTSDTVTLNVKPYLIINTQPVSTVTGFNPSSSTLSTKASLSDTRSPWQNYKLEYQWWEKNKENTSIVPNTRLIDGDYEVVLSTSKTVEQVVNNTQFTTLTESVSSGVSKRVGIPTEATEVTFTVSGGIGGSGGDENSSNLGGIGGAGKSGEFKFSDSEINNIRNAGAPTEYILSSGSKGDDGATQISVAGGIGGLSFDQDVTITENDSVFGGRGGSSGPGGVSGSGGGGGGGSAVISSTGEWMVIAGGGGGGAGSSPESPGADGQDAGDWKEFDIINSINPNELKPATVVNFNPKAGTTQGNNIQNPIQYGFYIKSTSPISSVDATTDYRVIVVWDNEVVVDTTSKLTPFDIVGLSESLLDGKFYVSNGNVNYFVSTHKGSELGWCDDESNLSSVCVRGDGGYVNSFDVIRYSELFSSGEITAYDGAIGASKLTGDGGGGGGAGGGAISPAAGGTAGANPVASSEVVVQFKVSGKNNTGNDYIRFVENSWYGFPETEPNRGQIVTFTENNNTQTVTLKAGVTYDVVSNFEEGDRTSDSLRILQDFTSDANQSDIIAGRSVGMNAGGVGDNIQTGNEDDFRDLIVTVSDGTFDVVPQTVRLEDGEIVGKSIIRYTAPTGFKNQTVASGGQGGQSQYNTIRLNKLSDSKNDSIGAVNMTIKTEQPFNELNQNIVNAIVRKNWSIRGAHPYTPYKDSGYTSTLEISSNYVFSKRIVCQITVKDTGVTPLVNAQTSFSNSLYTDTVDFTVIDDRDNVINIERIRHNDDFAIVSSLNLDNSDITFERSGSTDAKDVEYYSFYSNRDIEVDIQMYGGKGNDQGAYVGGEGGFSYLRLNMEKDTEYVIAGLNDYVNTPFLFKKGQLLAVVGGGGDAGYNGNGAPGGGVSVNGGNAYAGGVGGVSPTTLGENGVHGSATNLLPVAPDTKASIPNGGTTIRCSKGNLFQFANQPNPCADRGTSVKFATSDGTLVTNTKEINRGFKAGYNIFNTAGRANGAVADIGWGGCGATGGQGSDTHGGGGGSGYIAPEDDLGIRVRSEGNSERVASITTQSGLQGSGGNPISSTLGGSTGSARVVISLAEIPTDALDEFIERPVAPTLEVSEEDVQREPEFIPLPEIVPPPPVTPPTPVLSITSAVSKGFVSGNKTYTSFSDSSAIGVLESGSIDFFVKTEDIPANTKFYWKVEKITSYGDEFDTTSGDFTTSLNSNGEVVGQFNVSPKVDNKTDWTDSVTHDWRIRIYTDANYNYEVNRNFNGRFRILDTSRTAPTAKLTSLIADATTGVKVKNEVNEGTSITVDVETLDIHNGQTIGWEIEHINTNASDFTATSGTATVSSGYQIDADGVPSELNSNKNKGTASFTIAVEDDLTTEGNEEFALKLKYPTSSSTYFVNTKDAIGEVKKTIRINDTSQNLGADISGDATIDENVATTYSLSVENFFDGGTIYWRIIEGSSGTTVASNDFVAATGTATVTVTGKNASGNRIGTASITITAKGDGLTEGAETFTLQLYRDSAYSTVINTIGTNTHSTKSITVNDTSLSPVQYGGFVTKSLFALSSANEGTELKFTPNAWNLSSVDDTNIKVYWIILDSNDEPAIQGTVDVRPLGADRTIIPDFNTIRGETTFKRIGYVKAAGNIFGYRTNSSGDFIVPYHIEKETQSFTAINDFFSDGDKNFKVAYFATKNDRDSLSNALFTTNSFTISDTSKTKIAFNSETGFGVAASSSSLLNAGQSLDSPSIDEGDTYYFRVETSAPPGTNLYYRVENSSSDDFITVDIDTLPDTTIGSFSYPIKSNTSISDELSGRVTTFDRDGGSTSQLIDGEECVRSIAYIYLKTNPDLATEGDETFDLAVYLNEDYSEDEAYVKQTVKINDTSLNIPPPTISLSLSSVHNTFGGNADNGYTVTSGDSEGPRIVLNWSIDSKVAPYNGSASGTGFNSGYYTDDDILRITEQPTWYAASGFDGGRLRPSAKGASDYTLTYSMSVTNKAGDGTDQTASDSVKLTVSALPAPPPPRVYKRYQAVPLWRYHRFSNSNIPRWSHTTYGPGAAGAPSDPYATGSSQWSKYWGELLFNITGSENGKMWSLHGSFGTAFTRAAPGTTSLFPTSFYSLEGPYFGNYLSNAFAYLNTSPPFAGGDAYFGAVQNWGRSRFRYGLGDAYGTDRFGNPTGLPIGMNAGSDQYWIFGAGVGSEAIDKWIGPRSGFHYWDVTDGISVYHGMSEPNGIITDG